MFKSLNNCSPSLTLKVVLSRIFCCKPHIENDSFHCSKRIKELTQDLADPDTTWLLVTEGRGKPIHGHAGNLLGSHSTLSQGAGRAAAPGGDWS